MQRIMFIANLFHPSPEIRYKQVLLYQGNPDGNHNLWNIVATER